MHVFWVFLYQVKCFCLLYFHGSWRHFILIQNVQIKGSVAQFHAYIRGRKKLSDLRKSRETTGISAWFQISHTWSLLARCKHLCSLTGNTFSGYLWLINREQKHFREYSRMKKCFALSLKAAFGFRPVANLSPDIWTRKENAPLY